MHDYTRIDTCFGVVRDAPLPNPAFKQTRYELTFKKIITHTSSSWTGNQETKLAPVTLSPFGDIMKLTFQDSKKYAGILALNVLCLLKEKFTIDYKAEMVASEPQGKQGTGKEKKSTPKSTHDCSVRIVVYGMKSEASSVGKMLADAELYLQQPFATECHREVDYWNPHYLLRPGSEMPKLEDLSLSPSTKNVRSSDVIDESHKSHFMRIFNSANGPRIQLNLRPSKRLKSSLKE